MDGHYKKKILYNNMSRNLNLTSTTSSKIILENITVSSGTGLESVSGKLYFNGEEVRSGGGLTHSAQILTSDGEIDFSNTSTLLKTGHVYTLPDGETIGFKKDIVNNDRGTNTNLIVSSNVKGGNITGVVGQVRDIESTTNGNIYIGGDFTLLSDGTFDSTSISLQFPLVFTPSSFRLHFDFKYMSLRFHVDVTSISHVGP